MYWINGSGNWSDTSHWTSYPVNQFSDCLPQDIDNVIFNEDSFDGSDTVNVDINEVRCHTMNWSGTDQPVLKNTTGMLGVRIYGSLQFMPSMVNQYSSPFYFCDSLGGQTITSAGQKCNNDIYFTGKGGWILMDSLDVEGRIHFLQGNLNTNGSYMSCETFHSDSSYIRSLHLGTSQVKINGIYKGNSWSLNTDSLEFIGGESKIEIIAPAGTLYQYGGDTVKYHDVLFSATSGTAKLFTFNDTYGVFHNVIFKGNGSIFSSNTIDSLSFSIGCYYDLESGKRQTINDKIFSSGECDGPILLKASVNGSYAQLESTTDTILLDYTAIRDIHTYGTAVFLAQNSVDLGNNTGWDTIQLTAPGKLFWVGGAGDWNDQLHWSLTSGGTGGECIPTPYDTVIFDQNSFSAADQYSQVNLNNAFAHNMDWSEADNFPEFKGTNFSAYLRIYGTLRLNPQMKFTFPAYIWFESSDPDETILTEGIKFNNLNNNVYFDGIGGEWTLIDSLQLGNSITNQNCIYFVNGNLNTNSQYVDCFSFYSTQSTPRKLTLENSEIRVQNYWYVYGNNLILDENQSVIQVDSGRFIHHFGNYCPYHVVNFNHSFVNQELICRYADSVFFDTITFHSPDGKMYGSLGTVYGHNIRFEGIGQINDTIDAVPNIYIFDSLYFNSTGTIYGNDTIRNFVNFNSTGYIDGDGVYKNALFNDNGNIFGNNIFDTLTFTPTHSYQLGSEEIQTIVDSLSIMGNNCQSIILYASSDAQAIIYKDTGSVYGDFIEMSRIKATGGAVFDAGGFSIDVDNSNEGWLFHATPLNYSLGSDISILEGETVDICASNFNGNSTTTYQWTNCENGDILGTDSCIFDLEKGHYCLSVTYTEGGGCVKTDDIYVGCHLDLLFDTTHVSCNGFSDGSIEMQILVGLGPFDISWHHDGNFLSHEQNIYNLAAGDYIYTITDTEECMSMDTITIREPDILAMSYSAFPACYEILNGAIALDVTGGTEPYNYSWSNGSSEPDLTGIGPGLYGVTLTDDHQCPPISETIVVSELTEILITLNGTNLNCFHDGSGAVEVTELSGGTGNFVLYEWLKDATFYAGTSSIGDLMAGTYTLKVTDDYGCYGIKSINLSEPNEIVLTLTADSDIETQGSAYLQVTGGVPPYSFLWNTGAISQDISYLSGGNYCVTVTDAHSCSVSDSIWVEVHYKVFAPTAFSPNGDGLNDQFVFFDVGNDLKELDLTIFDRFGKKVFQTSDIKNCWNGKMHNSAEDCPVEVYTWYCKLLFTNGESWIYNGNVSLLR
jgi:gliding motility-associated-like protein